MGPWTTLLEMGSQPCDMLRVCAVSSSGCLSSGEQGKEGLRAKRALARGA